MKTVRRKRAAWAVRSLICDCDGQDLVEYCLLIAVVALGCVVALGGFQNVINNVWQQFSSGLNSGS